MVKAKPVNQALVEHMEFFEPFMKQIEMGILLMDSERHIHWINPTLERMNICNFPVDTMEPGMTLPIDESRCEDCQLWDICSEPSAPVFFCRQFDDPDSGVSKSYSIFSQSYPPEALEPEYRLLAIRDTSERELAYKEKQELETVVSNVLNNTVDAVITMDNHNTIHSWNRGAVQVFGYSSDEIHRKNIRLLIPDDEKAQTQFEIIQRLLDEQGFVRNYRARMRPKNTPAIDVAVTQTVMRNHLDEPIGHSLIIRDISKVVNLEKTLSLKVEQLEKLLQLDDIIRGARNLQDIYTATLVSVTAGDGLRFNRSYLLRVDEEFERLIGVQAIGPSSGEEAHSIYSRQIEKPMTLSELINQHLEEGNNVDMVVNQQAMQIDIPLNDLNHPLIKCLNDREPYLFVRGGEDDQPLGSLLEVLNSDQFVAVPMSWQNQNLGLILADNFINRTDISMEDINLLGTFASRIASAISNIQLKEDLQIKIQELKSSYKQLSDSEEIALRQERLAALGEVSSKVAHEIRNPLSTIGGFARLIFKHSSSEEDKKYLKIISSEASRLERILQDILGYVRSDSTDMTPCNINQLLEECCLMVERQTKKKEIHFVMDLGDRLPTIVSNPDQMKQVLLNGMQNGIDAMGRSGTLTIKSRLKGEMVSINISDTGSGIETENFSQLFKPFFTTKSSGIGLGLNITRKIVEQHGGTVKIDSDQEIGTRLNIRLPIGGKEAKHDGSGQEETSDRG